MKDTDFVFLSAWIRTQEPHLLTRERRERMVEARTDEEWVKVLEECGYAEPADLSIPAVNASLAQARENLFAQLKKDSPDLSVVEVFQIKYDYHNAKALIKAEAMGEEVDRLLMVGGRYAPKDLLDSYHRGDLDQFTVTYREALKAASRELTERRDPQRADMLLDKACYEEMTAAAQASGSPFLQGYVRLSIDGVNLRTAVRCARMGAPEALLQESLLPGGNVEAAAVAAAETEELPKWFSGPLEKAARLGAERTAPGSGSLTGFERACDDALTAYLAQAKWVAFGEEPVVAYVCAREAEATAIRTILSGRKAGLSAEAIRERLRESYV